MYFLFLEDGNPVIPILPCMCANTSRADSPGVSFFFSFRPYWFGFPHVGFMKFYHSVWPGIFYALHVTYVYKWPKNKQYKAMRHGR